MNNGQRRVTGSCVVVVALSIAYRSASAVTIETVPVGNPGNAPDTRYDAAGFGSVGSNFRIGTTEVTNAQYVAFLNGVDLTGANSLALYDSTMTTDAHGGILFTNGAANGSKYSVKPGRDNNPVVWVSWYDAIRFANWLHNGQASGDTESGAYTLGALGPVGWPNEGNSITRNPGAKWWLPSEDEWYKAAYHKNDGATGNYWDYPTSTNADPNSDQPPGGDAPDPSNTANFFNDDNMSNGYDDGYAATGSPSFSSSQNYLTDVGAYSSALSPYGTFDQGGNVWEWNETLIFGLLRVQRGGSPEHPSDALHASVHTYDDARLELGYIGFRVASVPEPNAIVLVLSALGIMLSHPHRLRRNSLTAGARLSVERAPPRQNAWLSCAREREMSG